MNYQIISIEDNELVNNDVWDVFDKKCDDSLTSEDTNIAICLRSEMESGVPLLDWLETWQTKFQKEGKSLYIISEDARQIESVELSNPDQHLVYFSSVKEYEDYINRVAPQVKEKAGKKNEEKTIEKDDYSQPQLHAQPKIISLNPGDTVTIAGEYLCRSCGVSRMWIKGREVTACENAECFEPSKGWKLDFDLF